MADPKYQKVWSEQKKAVRKGDTILKDAKSSDIVILILGPPGVGKSTFINSLLGREEMEIGHDLKACTTKIKHVVLPHPRNSDQRLVLVDTPSFDIIEVADIEILRRFSVWLATAYTADTRIGGVIYLHDISSSMEITILKNLDIFQKLCGTDRLDSFILGTTKWDFVKPAVGEKREAQLVTDYWKRMIDGGSTWYRFLNTSASAWEMVNKILDVTDSGRNMGALRLQLELVDFQRSIPETETGKALRHTMQQLEAEIQRESSQSHQPASLPTRLFKSLFDAKSHEITRTTEVNVQTKYASRDISSNHGIATSKQRSTATIINHEERITRTVEVNTSIKLNDAHWDVHPRSDNKPAAHVPNRKGDSVSNDNSQPVLITAGESQADSIASSQRIPSAPAKRNMDTRVHDSVSETSLSGGHDVHILEKVSAPDSTLDNSDHSNRPPPHTVGKITSQANIIRRASSTPVELPESSIVDGHFAKTPAEKDDSTFAKDLDNSRDHVLQSDDVSNDPIESGDRLNYLAQQCGAVVIKRTCSVESQITQAQSVKTISQRELCDNSPTTDIQPEADDVLQESRRVPSTSVTETQTTSVTGSQIFGNSPDFGISGAVMNDGANSTITYHHTDTHTNTTYNNDTHIHFHFNQPLDPEMKDFILKGIERSKGNTELDNDGVHIHKRQAYVVGSSKKKSNRVKRLR